jgi:uncharacterized protein YdeI (YjbR/CyaY-like superfamily)
VSTGLKRARHPMPLYVKKALQESGLMDTYHTRPPYQQNDYIGWITRAKKEETGQKRLVQMLDELKRGDVYMNMAYRPKK